MHRKFTTIPELEKIYKEYAHSFKDQKSIQIIETYNTSLQSLLRTEDRNSMRHSVESRLPYLDYLNYEHCLNLPLDQKIKDGWTKFSLRDSKIISGLIGWRKDKIGFNSPYKIWINKYSEEMREVIKKSFLIDIVIRKKYVINNWHNLSYKQKWCLFNLSKWEEIFKMRI